MSVMLTGAITPYIDVAQVTLYVFWAFFAGLVLYLQRESRREGFPLQDDKTDRVRSWMTSWMPTPKTYLLPGGGSVSVPNTDRENQNIATRRMGRWGGSAQVPTGNPMVDAVGPASFANRADVPDRMQNGDPRLLPMRRDETYHLDEQDNDPIGMDVVDARGERAGTIVDVWIDRAEHAIRYFEVNVAKEGAPRNVLLPINFTSRINGRTRSVRVNAILASQFANVPTTKNADLVTLLEEDKIMGYYGGGLLYATPARAEPVL